MTKMDYCIWRYLITPSWVFYLFFEKKNFSWRERMFIQLEKCDMETFEILFSWNEYCSSYTSYAKDKNHFYWCWKIIEWVDNTTFEILNSSYAKDRYSVFYQGKKMQGVKPQKFYVILWDYIVYDHTIYFWKKSIENPDFDTFSVMNSFFAKDKNAVYYQGEIMKQFDVNTCEILPFHQEKEQKRDREKNMNNLLKNPFCIDDDLEIFQLDSKFIKDKNMLCYANQKLDKIELKNITVFNQNYVGDSHTLYFKSHLVENVELSSFQVLTVTYGKDRINVYHKNRVISHAYASQFQVINNFYTSDQFFVFVNDEVTDIDVSSLKVFNHVFAKDRNAVYVGRLFWGTVEAYLVKKIEWADVETFEVLNDGTAKDKNNKYTQEWKIKNK